MNLIVKMKFGSHLYGTSTPESDIDFKGVFLPTKEEIFLNRVPKSINTSTNKSSIKNSADDIDCEIYSLHYFIKLACEGQTVALDMLHAPDEMIKTSSEIWHVICRYRDKFYTKNLQAFIGYARRQASKYGIKGSRLSAAKSLINHLATLGPDEKLALSWDKLPTGEHMHQILDSPNGIKQYQICGKIIQETQKAGYTIDIITKFYNDYGLRAKEAAENKNIDWKAVSHAARAAIQLKELLSENTITFPLKEAGYLLKVKSGVLDYTTEVAPHLETLMDEVEILSEKSTLPAKVDRKFWDNFIVEVVNKYVL